VVSDASACAVKNCGSSNSLIAGILSIGRTSGSGSIVKYDIALADASIEKRRIDNGIVVAQWNYCARIDRFELYVHDFFPKCAAYIYIWRCLFTENITGVFAILCDLIEYYLSICHNFWFDMIGVLNWLRCRIIKWIYYVSIRWYSIYNFFRRCTAVCNIAYICLYDLY